MATHPEVERLAALLPPPAGPEPPATPWKRAGPEAGLAFPADYRAFADRYGGGRINGELTVAVPSRTPPWPGLPGGFPGFARYAEEVVGPVFRELREDDPAANPYPLHPEPGGLLPWATSLGADHCFWLTADPDPDRWPVVVWLRQAAPPRWRRFDGGGTVAFLRALLDGTAPCAAALVGAPGTARWERTTTWEARTG